MRVCQQMQRRVDPRQQAHATVMLASFACCLHLPTLSLPASDQLSKQNRSQGSEKIQFASVANHHGSIDKLPRRMPAATVSSEGLHSARTMPVENVSHVQMQLSGAILAFAQH